MKIKENVFKKKAEKLRRKKVMVIPSRARRHSTTFILTFFKFTKPPLIFS